MKEQITRTRAPVFSFATPQQLLAINWHNSSCISSNFNKRKSIPVDLRIMLAVKPLKWFAISASIHSPRFKPRAIETRYYCGMVLTIFSVDWAFSIGMSLNPFLLIVCIVLDLSRHGNRLDLAKPLFNLRINTM